MKQHALKSDYMPDIGHDAPNLSEIGKKKGSEKKDIQLNAVVLEAAEGGYVSINPETGTASQGETRAEAVSNLREATELYLETRPDECPQGETVGVGTIEEMMVSVDASALEDE